MSAIAGVLHRTGRPVNPDTLQAMVACQRHRGPDRSGTWHQRGTGLGHAALQVTPESRHETLPHLDRTARLVISADVRLDNRADLIRLLQLEPHGQECITDSALILGAYQAWGTECPAKLLGDFAFAIWDEPEQRFFVARDHFGTKPLTYYCAPQVFVFASEIKALLCHAEVPRRINAQRIADYLVPYFEGYDKRVTFYEDIWRLPPAHYMIIRRDTVTLRCYWTPDVDTELHYPSDDDYAEAFRHVLSEAVESRLRSTPPVASMLSGGMDSSSIVWTARDVLARSERAPLHTISAITHDAPWAQPEVEAIQRVINMDGLVAHTISPDQLGPHQDRFRQLLSHTDDLFDLTLYPIMLPIYHLAQQHGIRRVMDGVDGDVMTWIGERCIPFLVRRGQLRNAVRVAVDCARFYQESVWPSLLRATVPTLSPASAWLPEPFVRRVRGRKRQQFIDSLLSLSVINRQFVHDIELQERYLQFFAASVGRRARSIREDHAAMINAAFMTVAFERYDRLAAACSVEACRPLLDKRVVDFCLALPWHQKALGGWSKPVLRRAMRGRLPSELLTRRNFENVGPRFAASWWQLEQPLIVQVIHDQLDTIRDYVDVPAVRQAYKRYEVRFDPENGVWPDDNAGWQDGWDVWTAVTLALWMSRNA